MSALSEVKFPFKKFLFFLLLIKFCITWNDKFTIEKERVFLEMSLPKFRKRISMSQIRNNFACICGGREICMYLNESSIAFNLE